MNTMTSLCVLLSLLVMISACGQEADADVVAPQSTTSPPAPDVYTDTIAALDTEGRRALCERLRQRAAEAPSQVTCPDGAQIDIMALPAEACLSTLAAQVSACTVESVESCFQALIETPCQEPSPSCDAVMMGCPATSPPSASGKQDIGGPCTCAGGVLCAGTEVACAEGLTCLWDDGRAGFCSRDCEAGSCPEGMRCQQVATGESMCVVEPEVELCGACRYSFECEPVEQQGASFAASCFNGRCYTNCSVGVSPESCACIEAAPDSGTASGYCSADC